MTAEAILSVAEGSAGDPALAAAWWGVIPVNLGIEMGVVGDLFEHVEVGGETTASEPFCDSPVLLAGLFEREDSGLGEADIKLGEAVMAAKKLAGSGTGDCFGGICDSSQQ